MKTLKRICLVAVPLLVLVFVYNCTTDEDKPEATTEVLAPKTAVSVEQARANRDNFIQSKSHNIKHSAFTYDYEELKQFVDYVEYQKSIGKDVKYFTVYLSQYQNGEQSAFIASLKEDGTPNYDMKSLNHGSLIPPKHGSGSGGSDSKEADTKIRF